MNDNQGGKTINSDGDLFAELLNNTETAEPKKTEHEHPIYNDAAIDGYIKTPARKTIEAQEAADFIVAYKSEQKQEHKKSRFPKTLLVVLPVLALAAVAAVLLLKTPKDAASCNTAYREIAALVTDDSATDEGGKLKKYAALKQKNADFTGFLTLPEQNFGYPVVTENEKETGYYTSHLFNGEQNAYGCLNTAEAVSADSEITVIRGVEKGDSLMLGGLFSFLKENYIKLHPTVCFDSEYKTGEWLVFSAFTYSGEAPFYIERIGFINEGVKTEYIKKLFDASLPKLDIAVDSADELLVLLAKGGDKTTVVACRKLRTGERAENPITESNAVSSAVSSKLQAAASSSAASSKAASSTIQTTASTATVQKPQSSTERRYEQTGLTDNMDKTAKVDVGKVVTMIDVTGTDKAQAKSILKNTLGVGVKFIEQESEEPRGKIIAQSVADGAEISSDVTVTLTVSIGLSGGETVMPDLIGNAQSNLETVLSKANLLVGKITKEKSSLEKGTVLSQSVQSGDTVAVNTKINVTVSDGSLDFKVVKMPKLTGKTSKAAQNAIKKAGLRVGKIKTVTSSKTAGTVTAQECEAGQSIEEGTTVSFSISNGSKVNNLTVTNQSSWSVKINGKSYAPGAIIKGDYMDIIPCIIEAEMGSGYHIEALKAQAVAAYCWLINAGSKSGAAPAVPMKTAGSRAISAANAVNGVKATYGGNTAQTYYYAISAGYSANCKDVWYADLPYLRAVESAGDKYASGFETTVTYTASELKKRVKDTYGVDLGGISKNKWFKVTYDENNAYARSISIGGKKTVTGSSFRDALLDYELRSTAFKIKYSGGKFTFTVRGYGHGVGMSQVGAEYYASKGWSYKEILKHYFKGVSIE